jgi:type I site-specific restriction endonuclease
MNPLKMKKKNLSESDIKAKFITPAILSSGWDEHTQIGREIYFTDGIELYRPLPNFTIFYFINW